MLWMMYLPFFAWRMSAGSGGKVGQWLGLRLGWSDGKGLPAPVGYLELFL